MRLSVSDSPLSLSLTVSLIYVITGYLLRLILHRGKPHLPLTALQKNTHNVSSLCPNEIPGVSSIPTRSSSEGFAALIHLLARSMRTVCSIKMVPSHFWTASQAAGPPFPPRTTARLRRGKLSFAAHFRRFVFPPFISPPLTHPDCPGCTEM